MDEGHGKKTVVEIRVTDVTFITVQRVRNIPVSLTPWSCGQTRNVLERVRTRLMRNLVEAHVHYPFMEAEGVAAGLSTSTAPLIFEEEGIDCSECPPLTAIDGSKPLTHFDVFGVESGAIDMTRPIGIEEYHDPDLENASVRSYSPSFTDWCSPQAILNNSNGNSRSRPRGNSAGSETMFADAANAEPVAFDFGSDPLLSVFDELEANDGNAEQEDGHSDSHSQGSSESGLQLDETGDTINLTRGLELNPDGHRSFVFEENENDAYGWVQIENPSISDVPSTLEAMLDNECYSLLHDAIQGAGANKGKVVPKRREWKLVRRANDISWYRRDFISQVKSSCVEAMASMHMWGSPDAILHCLLEECDEEILPNGLVVKRSVSQVSHEICNATEIKNKLNPWTTVTSEVHLLPGIRRPCKTCLLKAVRKLSDGTIFVVVKSVVDDGGEFRSKKLGRKLQAWKDYNQLTILRQGWVLRPCTNGTCEATFVSVFSLQGFMVRMNSFDMWKHCMRTISRAPEWTMSKMRQNPELSRYHYPGGKPILLAHDSFCENLLANCPNFRSQGLSTGSTLDRSDQQLSISYLFRGVDTEKMERENAEEESHLGQIHPPSGSKPMAAHGGRNITIKLAEDMQLVATEESTSKMKICSPDCQILL